MITLTLNGKIHETSASTVKDLVEELVGEGSQVNGIAVAVNGKVVARSQWDQSLQSGETVDVLNAVQGG